MMKCLVFDRGDGVLGIGLKILFGGIDQFCIAWPDRPPERMTHDFLLSNGVSILGEGELILPSPKFETLEQLREAWDNAPTIDDIVEPVDSAMELIEGPSKLVEINMAASAIAGELVPADPTPVAPTLVDPSAPVLEPVAPVVESQPAPEPAPPAEVPVEQPTVSVEPTSAIDMV
jgi:hypothetical protein